MEKIGTYRYQSGLYDPGARTGKSAEEARASEAKGTEASGGKKPAVLSKAAQNLLKELQKSYSNVDFIVADYETEEEAAALLSRGTSEYSALLTTDELEKMAADEDAKKENLRILDDAVSKLGQMKTRLGDKAEDVTRVGIAIGDNGEVSFFAELEKSSARQRELIEKRREEKKEASREEEKAEAKKAETERTRPAAAVSGKRTTVYASTVEELAEKIGNVDWGAVKAEGSSPAGQRFDFTV